MYTGQTSPPPSRYMNSKYYLAAYMLIHIQFWKEALSAFREKVSLHDTLIYWCNYHISIFSGGGEQIFIGHFTQHIETNHNLAGSFTATDMKLLTNIYVKTNIDKNKHLTAVGL